ncbi:MAG TPA: DUF3006 domain-containing protein [Patescibacteria group bacterium]|nr:DUF3006 domain-containing protein [Patescibacteria group bacterium]
MEQIVFDKKRPIACTVDRFEGQRAVLKLEDGQSLGWPIDKLPGGVSEGSEVKIFLTTAKNEEEERERTAKAVLNELLKTE